jgi:hypothetical protein
MASIRNCLVWVCLCVPGLYMPSAAGQITTDAIHQAYVDGHGPARAVAQQAWEVDKTTLRPEDLARFGFTSMSQLQDVKLGEPIPVFALQQFSLAKYQNGQNFLQILSPVIEVKYPLQTSAGVVSAISAVNVEGRWVPGVFGGRAITRLLQQAVTRLDAQKDSLLIVEIPSLHKYIIADAAGPPAIRVLIDGYGRETVLRPESTLNFQLNTHTGVMEPSETGACERCTPETNKAPLSSKTSVVLSDLAQEAQRLKAPQ